MPLRWLTVSNSADCCTGYGVQTRHISRRLAQDGHAPAVFGYFGTEGALRHVDGIPHYPRLAHPYGEDVLGAHAQHWRADVSMTLTDAFVFDYAAQWAQQTRWVCYCPMDHERPIPKLLTNLQHAFSVLAMCRNGQEQLAGAGIESHYTPHGVECGVYQPIDRSEARRALGLPDDAFIVGMVAMNKGYPSRKAIEQNMRAFARFARQHDDAQLVLHTNIGNTPDGRGGLNLAALVGRLSERYGVANLAARVRFCDQYQSIVLGAPDHQMVATYNALDVLLAPGHGEGFGIPTVEAQACGTPVITGGWCASQELTFAGWALAPAADDDDDSGEADLHYTLVESWQHVPRAGAIAQRLELAYAEKGNEVLRRRAREGALQYDMDYVWAEHWRPAIRAIEEKIADTTSVTLERWRRKWFVAA